jgi:MYXO-CTERM domain-containing protein
MYRALLALTVLLATQLPLVADACSPPPNYWWLEDTLPADGAQDVALDAAVAVLGRPDMPEYAWDFLGIIQVEVTADGQPVAGDLSIVTEDLVFWLPAEPLTPGTEYSVEVRLENWDGWFEGEGETERAFSFITGERRSGVPAAPPVEGLEVSQRAEVLTECVAEFPVGSCDWCETWAEVGHQQRLTATVDTAAFTAEWGWAHAAEVWVTPGPGNGLHSRIARRARAGEGLHITADLGPRRDWPSDEICTYVRLHTPGAGTTDSERVCTAIAPYDPTDDRLPGEPIDGPEDGEDHEVDPDWPNGPDGQERPPNFPHHEPVGHDDDAPMAQRGDGCTATPAGGAPAWGTLALFVAAGLRRRRPLS